MSFLNGRNVEKHSCQEEVSDSPLESLRQCSHHDASSDEAIKAYSRLWSLTCVWRWCYRKAQRENLLLRHGLLQLTILLLQHGHECRRQVVSKVPQSIGELVTINGSRAIAVEVLECLLPVCDVFPEALEL